MTGERNMIRKGYRWDVIACFAGNSSGVRVAVRKTKRGAARLADELHRTLRPHVEQTYVRLRHDPLLDDAMNSKNRKRDAAARHRRPGLGSCPTRSSTQG